MLDVVHGTCSNLDAYCQAISTNFLKVNTPWGNTSQRLIKKVVAKSPRWLNPHKVVAVATSTIVQFIMKCVQCLTWLVDLCILVVRKHMFKQLAWTSLRSPTRGYNSRRFIKPKWIFLKCNISDWDKSLLGLVSRILWSTLWSSHVLSYFTCRDHTIKFLTEIGSPQWEAWHRVAHSICRREIHAFEQICNTEGKNTYLLFLLFT